MPAFAPTSIEFKVGTHNLWSNDISFSTPYPVNNLNLKSNLGKRFPTLFSKTDNLLKPDGDNELRKQFKYFDRYFIIMLIHRLVK